MPSFPSFVGLAMIAVFIRTLHVNAHTDLASQWYRMYQQSPQDDPLIPRLPAPKAPPEHWTALLNGTSFDELPALLQRALLWESGLVRIAGHGEQYAQVYTRKGAAMTQLFISQDSINASLCTFSTCEAPARVYASEPSCPVEVVLQQAMCAIVDDRGMDIETVAGPFWSPPVELTTQELLVYRVGRSAVNAPVHSMDLFTIHQQAAQVRDLSGCKAPSFIIPCERLTWQKLEQQSAQWQRPMPNAMLELWVHSALATDAVAKEQPWSVAAIVAVSIAVVLAILCVVMLIQMRRTREETEKNSMPHLSPGDVDIDEIHVHATASGSDATAKKKKSKPRNGRSAKPGQIEAGNAAICERSDRINGFVQDQVLQSRRIDYDSLVLGRVIAKGANGEVLMAQLKGKQVAVKRLLRETKEKNHLRALEHFVHEIELASGLAHPNIVTFLGVTWRSLWELCIISEFMVGGDLAQFLHSKRGRRSSWADTKLSIAIDIANALIYLHSLVPVIIHRDLKSSNVLLTSHLEAKLSDFGLSRERSLEETMTSGIGTILWTAPEVLRGDRYSEKADIYSFGVVLSELDTCLAPYSLNKELTKGKANSFHVVPLISQGAIRPCFQPTCPVLLHELASKCLDVHPDRRPSAIQIVHTLRTRVKTALLEAASCADLVAGQQEGVEA